MATLRALTILWELLDEKQFHIQEEYGREWSVLKQREQYDFNVVGLCTEETEECEQIVKRKLFEGHSVEQENFLLYYSTDVTWKNKVLSFMTT